jgi:hypothetical protein
MRDREANNPETPCYVPGNAATRNRAVLVSRRGIVRRIWKSDCLGFSSSSETLGFSLV